MRNLKRALSLALASVMLVGMMVVGTSAASFPDVDDSYNVEAIEVLNAVEVMIGDNGDFRPDDNVTRNEMAVIMAKLMLGPDADKYVGTHPFNDVPEWADKYVAACYNEGIVAGRDEAAGIYDGQSTVTAEEAAAMMLRALGYEKLEKIGQGYPAEIVKQANKISLFKNVGSNPKAPMVRNAVAQLALNTLEATMVDSDIEEGIIIDGVITMPTKATYTEVENGESWNNAIDETNGTTIGKRTVQLGEYLYKGDLRKTTGDADDFGRPADHAWTMKGVSGKVGNASKEAVATFTGKTSAGDVATALSGYFIDDATNVPVNNKDTVRSGSVQGVVDNNNASSIAVTNKTVAKAIADVTANGKVVEIYATDSVITNVVMTTYSVGKVGNVVTNSAGTTYSITGLYTATSATGTDYDDPDKDDTISIVGDIAKDDYVTYVKPAGGKVTFVYATDSFTGTQSAYSDAKDTVTVDGADYDVAVGAFGLTANNAIATNFANSDDEATFYVDQFGYVVKSEAVSGDKDYAVINTIRWIDDTSSIKTDGVAKATLIFTDGTTEDITVSKINGFKPMKKGTNNAQGSPENAAKLDPVGTANGVAVVDDSAAEAISNTSIFAGKIVEYTVDSDGKYELEVKGGTVTQVAGNGNGAGGAKDIIIKGSPSITAPALTANNATLYIVKTLDTDGDAEYNVYTGFKNVPTITLAQVADTNTKKAYISYTTKSSGVAEYIFVDATAGTTDSSADGDVLYIFSKDYKTQGTGSNRRYVYTDVALNGEMVASLESKVVIPAVGLYDVSVDPDGTITKATATAGTAGSSNKFTAGLAVTAAPEEGTLTAGGVGYTYTDGQEAYLLADDDCTVSTVEAINQYDKVYIKAKASTGTDSKVIDQIYIVQADGNEGVLPNDATASDIATALESKDKIEISGTLTPDAAVTVGDGKTLVLDTANLNTAGISVAKGGNLEVDTITNAGTNGINVAAGGTLTIKGTLAADTTITGGGNVILGADVALAGGAAGTTGKVAAADADMSTKANGSKTTVDVPANAPKLSGEGKITTFSTKSMDDLAARTGSSSVTFYTFKVNNKASGKVSIVWTLKDGTTANAYTDAGATTTEATLSGAKEEFVVGVGDNVASAVITYEVSPSGTESITLYFNGEKAPEA